MVQPLEELNTILHVVSLLLAESVNALWDLPLLRSLTTQLRGRALPFTCTNSS
jgi:hypothetical protein